MSRYQIWLPYYKQGDDLGHFIQTTNDLEKSFQAHAEMLHSAATQLERICEVVGKYGFDKVVVDANVHFIDIDGPKEMMEELLKGELIEKLEDDDEDEWERMCCGEWGEDECEYCSGCCCVNKEEEEEN